MSARPPPPLIGITPGRTRAAGDADGLDELERRIHDALRGGLCGVLLREPALEDGPLAALAARLRARAPALWIGLHDRPHLAAAVGADAVHLGATSLTPLEARAWLDARVGVGLSTHAGDETARWRGADYLFHGPVWATPKERPREPLGPAGLAAAVRRAAVPVFALGGISPERVAAARSAGAAGVAVLSGLIAAADPAGRAAAFLAALAAVERGAGGAGPPSP